MNYILSKFSHELRNPLTSLYSSIQLIETQHPEVKEFKYWKNLGEDIRYMRQLLDDLSDFTKSETVNLSTFSLYELLEQISLSFAATIADSDVEYTSKISPSIQQITGDKIKLQEVFRNLLKNAFDATRPNKTIYLDASLQGENVVVTIRDTGIGIAPEQLENIFEPFVTYKKDGTGLGLAISKRIVEAHGGNISLTSTENEGTTVTVTLPLNLSLL